MKRKLSAWITAVLLAQMCLISALAGYGDDYGYVHDETKRLSSPALTELGENILDEMSGEYDMLWQVDVLDAYIDEGIQQTAAEVYDNCDYGTGEQKCGVTLTIGADVDDHGRVTLDSDNWCIYIGGTDTALTESTLQADITAAVAPYFDPVYWNGDMEISRKALAHAVNAFACAADNSLSGKNAPITDLTGGLLGEESELDHAIDDFSGVLTAEERTALEQQAQALAKQYDCGIYVVLLNDYSAYGADVKSAAQAFYAQGNRRENGILLLLSLNERDYALYANGDFGKAVFDDSTRSELEDAFLPAFGENNWSEGLSAYITAVEPLLQQGANGASPVKGILISIAISCGIALLVCLILKGKMKSVRKGAEVSEYVTPGSLHITDRYERYTHTTETRRTIEKKSSDNANSGKF
jgi:uncharacterized protein